MKKKDSLTVKILKPKKQTVDFILRFSQSLAALKMPKTTFLVSKN